MSQSDRNPPVSRPGFLADEGVAAAAIANVEGGEGDDGRPKFTSVAMDGGGTDQQRLLRSAVAVPSSSGANRPNSGSIQRPKPMGKSSRPRSIGKPQRLAASPSSSRGTSPVAPGTSSGVGNDFSVENSSQAWNVTDESLQSLPPYYPPLEKQSSVVITDGTPATVVAKRISDCFRERSITVEFDNKQNLARARTWDNITFSVKLHRESNDNDFGVWPGEEEVVPSSTQSGGGVIVEVQLLRASGPTGEGSRIVFYRDYCRPILRAAAGFGGNGMPSLSRGERRRPGASSSSVVFPVSSSRLYRCTDDIPPAKLRTSNMVVPQEKTLLALENVLDLLKKDRIDANRLGMESLYLLTNVNSVGYDTALVVAHVILHGRCCSSSAGDDDNNENVATGMDSSAYGIVFGEIHDVIVSLIQHRRLMLGGFSIEDGDSSDDDDDSSSSDNGHGRGRGAGGASFCDMAMTTDVLEREHVGLFHNLALKALTNSLQLFYDLGRHADIASSPFCNLVAAASVADHHPSSSPHPPVFAALLGEIDEVSRRSSASSSLSLLGAGHNGALAARCVDIMTRTCPEVREYATSCVDAMGIMEGARRSTGGMHHPILVRETESVLDVLRATTATAAAAPAAR